MVVTTIGNSDDKIYISDNVVPADGSYVWYFNGDASFTDDIQKVVEEMEAQDTSVVLDGFILKILWSLTTELANNSDFLNMFKARYYWSKNNTLLYLWVQNELSANNLARIATYVAPETNISFRGQLKRIAGILGSGSTSIRVLFKHYAEAT